MAFASNPGFLAAAFIDCSGAFILLVLYVLLAQGFPARFFRYWLGGWTLYVFVSALEVSHLWNGGPDIALLRCGTSLATAAVFFAAILECCGYRPRLKYAWPFVLLVPMLLFLIARKSSQATFWSESLSESALYIGAGMLLWRTRARHRGLGWKILAGSLLARGLHGIDRPDWPSAQALALFRVSAHDLLGITMGVAMAVLVLEAGRERVEELNEKMRSLALITAEATQSLHVHAALDGILHNILPTLAVSHGALFLLERDGHPASFALRASSGFGETFSTQYAQVFVSEPWIRDTLAQNARVVSREASGETKVPAWMEKEQLSSAVLVPITGKNKSLGLLCVASSSPRRFENEEVDFLVNVANLLGLAVQNVSLIEAAATARRQWLDTFNSIDDLIFVHSADGQVLRANRALAWHFGLEPDFVEGQLLRDLFKQGDVRWVVCPYCEGAAGKPEQVDPTFGGHFLVTNSGFHDSDGNRLGTAHVLKDFTERRQAESKFRTLFEKVQEGIFISTPDGRFLDFNDAFMRMLGFGKREELLRASIPDLYVDPAERLRLQRLLHDYGGVTDFEFRFRRRDGENRIARESSFVTRDDSGTIVAYQGFVIDVTDQKQAEMEIRRRNRELLALNDVAQLLAETSQLDESLTEALEKIAELFSADVAAVYFLDEESRTLRRAASFGHTSEFAKRSARLQISNSLIQQVRQARATVVSGAALALPEEFRDLLKAENVVVSQIAVLWVKDRITGVLSVGWRETQEFSTAELNLLEAVGNRIATTIDKSRLLEETSEAYETLRETQEQLLQSEKMAAVGQLISGVAHELNNPLTAILGYSQLLKNEQSITDRSAEYLEKLYKQAQRTHRIVENLLSFSRQHKPERGPVQINRAIEETLALREFDLKVNRVQVHLQLDPTLPEISADFHQLQQVILNILNNAVDAVMDGQKKPQIWIRTSCAYDKLLIEFTDNGPGVKNPYRVFDPFYTTKPVGKGTGLGLSICYGIVKEHGGEIGVHDAAGGGATFTVTLPLAPYNPDAPETPSRPLRADSKTVLLLDQDDAVLQLEQEVLVSRGMIVLTARTAQEAIDILQREPVDAAILDMDASGGLSVADLCAWIGRNRPKLSKRILFTSWNGACGQHPPVGKSHCRVISKPFEHDSFWSQAREILSAELSGTTKR